MTSDKIVKALREESKTCCELSVCMNGTNLVGFYCATSDAADLIERLEKEKAALRHVQELQRLRNAHVGDAVRAASGSGKDWRAAMERLTFDGNFCDIAQCRDLPCPYDNNCMQKLVWERLRDYEDAGLSPKACSQARKIEDGLNADDYSIARMVELMKADVVPVVRLATDNAPCVKALMVVLCKDCKYGDYDSKPNGAMICLRTNDGFWRKETDFCSYGELKEHTHGES